LSYEVFKVSSGFVCPCTPADACVSSEQPFPLASDLKIVDVKILDAKFLLVMEIMLRHIVSFFLGHCILAASELIIVVKMLAQCISFYALGRCISDEWDCIVSYPTMTHLW